MLIIKHLYKNTNNRIDVTENLKYSINISIHNISIHYTLHIYINGTNILFMASIHSPDNIHI